MKFSELSVEDQSLLNTQFPEELEKAAAAEVQLFEELYTVGSEKLAADAADAFDKLASEEKEKEEEEEQKPEMDEEHHKKAAEMGAVIERAQFDGLRKLGSERHNDEWYYIRPMVEEKIAGVKERIMGAAGKVRDAVAKNHGSMKSNASAAWSGASKGALGETLKLTGKQRAAHAGKAALHGSPYAAAAGAAGVGAYSMAKKKDKK